MSLKRFDYRIKDHRKKNTIRASIAIMSLVIVGIKLYNSYAKFEVQTSTYDLVSGNVIEPVNAASYITSLKTNGDTSLEYDDTEDNNLRYVGSNPDNYVLFNGELWRIIGVMNNVDGGSVSGDDATRVKLIRDESLGDFPYYEECLDENMIYDAQNDKWGCTNFRYNNNWPNSTADEIINDLYWNRKTHAPYNAYMYFKTDDQTTYQWKDYKTEAIDFSLTGLKNVYQNMMEPATYYLGGYTWNDGGTYDGLTMNTKQYYTAERTNQGNNNELTWTGNLGLMYPSDYGYASSGSVSGNSCRNIALSNWSSSANAQCKNNDWLLNGSFFQWTMTSGADNSIWVADIHTSGVVFGTFGTNDALAVRPVAYLKSTVKIIAGPNSDGSASHPYKLTM